MKPISSNTAISLYKHFLFPKTLLLSRRQNTVKTTCSSFGSLLDDFLVIPNLVLLQKVSVVLLSRGANRSGLDLIGPVSYIVFYRIGSSFIKRSGYGPDFADYFQKYILVISNFQSLFHLKLILQPLFVLYSN